MLIRRFFLGADGVKVLKAKISNVDYRFLYYVLCNAKIPNTGYNRHFKWLKEVEIPLPPLETQKQIAANLDKVTYTINLCNEILEKLDLLVKARFVEMFGDISIEQYKYQTQKLGDVAFVGSSHRVFTTEFVDNGIPFYRGTEIGELANGIKPLEPYYISEEHYKRLSNDESKPKIGDLLMPSICNKGQIWMVDTEEPFYYKDGRVLCISANREIYNTKYLQYFLREKTKIEYPKLGSGSTFAEFKIFILKELDILTPPMNVQNQFADFVTQTDKSKSAVKQVLEKAETLKKALMQEYFG
ncbi:MAG: restriction endonuclease subunit S [Oscillospiraceae bacterium]|nr:restriction endonuclease subunit S [Oscillospiraceae bacterium]